jgi:hypothetical protein
LLDRGHERSADGRPPWPQVRCVGRRAGNRKLRAPGPGARAPGRVQLINAAVRSAGGARGAAGESFSVRRKPGCCAAPRAAGPRCLAGGVGLEVGRRERALARRVRVAA